MRGIQAGEEYYVSICKLELISKLFLFNDDQLPPELRAQRRINMNRIPEITRYITENPDSYVFSALTASVDGSMTFEVIPDNDDQSSLGLLHIPMSSNFVINDGQHRRAAIELALHDNPTLANENIAVVFFADPGLKRSQQMFADLNRYAVKPSKSLGILYDNRDPLGDLIRRLAFESDAFKTLVDLEKTNLSLRSMKLFTLSSIYTATKALLLNLDPKLNDESTFQFWNVVAQQFPQWEMVRRHKITAGEVRQDYIHPHSIVLHAIGITGNQLLIGDYSDWSDRLTCLRQVDWLRSNTKIWEGMVMVGGRIVKSRQNVLRTICYLKRLMSLPLSRKEEVAIRTRESYSND